MTARILLVFLSSMLVVGCDDAGNPLSATPARLMAAITRTTDVRINQGAAATFSGSSSFATIGAAIR